MKKCTLFLDKGVQQYLEKSLNPLVPTLACAKAVQFFGELMVYVTNGSSVGAMQMSQSKIFHGLVMGDHGAFGEVMDVSTRMEGHVRPWDATNSVFVLLVTGCRGKIKLGAWKFLFNQDGWFGPLNYTVDKVALSKFQ